MRRSSKGLDAGVLLKCRPRFFHLGKSGECREVEDDKIVAKNLADFIDFVGIARRDEEVALDYSRCGLRHSWPNKQVSGSFRNAIPSGDELDQLVALGLHDDFA